MAWAFPFEGDFPTPKGGARPVSFGDAKGQSPEEASGVGQEPRRIPEAWGCTRRRSKTAGNMEGMDQECIVKAGREKEALRKGGNAGVMHDMRPQRESGVFLSIGDFS